MEFNGTFNGKTEANEENNNSPKSQSGAPVRWDFKAILKQEEKRSAEVNSSSSSASAVNETSLEKTGDTEFDREWAAMMAKEEEEKAAKFAEENQITPVAEMKEETSATTEIKTEAAPAPVVMRKRPKSLAEIMNKFGNPGTDDEENLFNGETTSSEATSAVVEPEPAIESKTEETVIPTQVEPVAGISSTPVSEVVIEPVAEITPEAVAEPVAEIISEPVAETWTEPVAEVTAEVSNEPAIETASEIVAEITNEPVAEIVAEPIAEVTIEPVAETAPEPVAEIMPVASVDAGEAVVEMALDTTEEIQNGWFAESSTEPVAEITEEFSTAWSEPGAEVAEQPVAEIAEELMIEIAAETPVEVTNVIMSESVNPIAHEDFEPIELAAEPALPVETAVPVFVNVEHAWMYAAETQQEPAEPLTEMSMESSLPGELPLFDSGSENEVTSQTDTHTHNNLKSEEAMKFELPEYSSIIKVIGVGGGGSNAVNHMYKQGIKGVDFLVCNTDKQALDLSPVPHKIVLGTTLTEGRGAGSIPEVGRNAAIENLEDLRMVLSNNTKMVFITAGMGGGTGTGAAPVIAGVARELGILTVGIVTVPFAHEGKKRRQYAEEGIEMLKQNVDTLLVIRNDKLREMYGNLKLSDAFAHADDVLTTAAKSIAEIISLTQQINVDFADICTVMRNSGVAIMGSAIASGENRAVRAVEMSLNSPLLNDNNIIGARYVLLNIISGADEITMDELGEITDFIQEAAGQTAEIIKGYGVDPSLGDSVSVTIIATGFQQSNPVNYEYAPKVQQEKVVRQLEEKPVVETPKSETTPTAETANNPLEPFLVSKPVEPVAEAKPVEIKTEWTSPNTVEFEFTTTSQEITEPSIEASNTEEVSGEITSAIEETIEEVIPEPVLIKKDEVNAEVSAMEAAKKAEQEEIQRRANERIQKLRDISLKLKSPQVLNEMENEPAYKRRNVNLENVPHSSESQVSRFTLTETEEKKIEIRPNNSFLHDNVD